MAACHSTAPSANFTPLRDICKKGHHHLFHSHFLVLPHSVLRCCHIHINDLLSGPASSDEHLGLKVEGAHAIGRIEGHTVLQSATVGQELWDSKWLTSLTCAGLFSSQAYCHLKEILNLKTTSHGWNRFSGICFLLIQLNYGLLG